MATDSPITITLSHVKDSHDLAKVFPIEGATEDLEEDAELSEVVGQDFNPQTGDNATISKKITPEHVKAPRLTKVLEGATADLEDAELPGIAGKVFSPVRDRVLVPIADRVTKILPTVVSTIPIPFLDDIGAWTFGVPFSVLKAGYTHLLPHEFKDEVKQNMDKDLNKAVKIGFEDFGHRTKPVLSSISGVVSFAVNTAIDITTIPFNGKLGEWNDAIVKFNGYLMYSGVGKDLLRSFFDDNALENMAIIGRIQAERNKIGGSTRRMRTAMSRSPVKSSIFKAIMCDAARFVRYSTAVYGVGMIDSADLLQNHHKRIKIDWRQIKIEKYINAKVARLPEPGGNMNLLGHLIAVDKRQTQLAKMTTGLTDTVENGNVVLAIRGTHSLSGIIRDAEGYTEDFCEGKAHAGFAELANNLWNEVEDFIVEKLHENPGYNLVITGHSLGAGVATLISLKLNYERYFAKIRGLESVKVSCFAFAPPPSYMQPNDNSKLTEAMKNTYSFIHENDCVPFMSVDAIHRLAHTMKDVDNLHKGFTGSRALMAFGLKPIPDELKDIVLEDPGLPPVPDGERLTIPSPFVIWMRKIAEKDSRGLPGFDAKFCHPHRKDHKLGTSDLSILLDHDMINDHLSPQYERAIYSVLRKAQSKEDQIPIK
mmetsp:Transcript_9124/g.13806  ORF Transcript_9124/g.13806 Transcript_9124/m.13806 type:complete len:652 (-) Transcript_9124:302-2257(-)